MTIKAALHDSAYNLEQLAKRPSIALSGPRDVLRAEAARLRLIAIQLPKEVADAEYIPDICPGCGKNRITDVELGTCIDCSH
jgi:hypothetical protein